MTAQVPAKDGSATRLAVLRRRADFVRVSRGGARMAMNAFTLQMAPREADAANAPARFGLTVTKKISGAVGRNRIRRRLREALRLGGALGARPGRDYVIVARRAALAATFADLVSQMTEGLARLNDRGAARFRRKQENRPSEP